MCTWNPWNAPGPGAPSGRSRWTSTRSAWVPYPVKATLPIRVPAPSTSTARASGRCASAGALSTAPAIDAEPPMATSAAASRQRLDPVMLVSLCRAGVPAASSGQTCATAHAGDKHPPGSSRGVPSHRRARVPRDPHVGLARLCVDSIAGLLRRRSARRSDGFEDVEHVVAPGRQVDVEPSGNELGAVARMPLRPDPVVERPVPPREVGPVHQWNMSNPVGGSGVCLGRWRLVKACRPVSILLMSTVLAACGGGGSSGDEAEKVVRDYIGAVSDAQNGEAYQLVLPKERAEVPRTVFDRCVSETPTDIATLDVESNESISDEVPGYGRLDGRAVTMRITVQATGDEQSSTDTFQAYEVDGDWYIGLQDFATAWAKGECP